MHWPEQPIESLPAFHPPHCPWAPCPSHVSSSPFRFRRHGTYATVCHPAPIPRFVCLVCRRSFSQQTFSTSYYLKLPHLSAPIAAGLVAGSAHRQIARSLACAPTTVTRRAARLGRHCLLLHAHLLDALSLIREPLVYDHFESFAHSQDEPCGFGTLVGHRTWFVYRLDFAPHRRAGRSTPAQKQRQGRLWSHSLRREDPYRAACASSFASVLDRLPLASPHRVYCDGKPSYLRALGRVPFRHRLDLRVHPNPKRGPKGSLRSAEARARDRALFPVDLLHGLLRHSAAHHRRETIAFARRHNAALERLALFAVWRDVVKRRSERDLRSRTPAMGLGLSKKPWEWERVFAQRLFVWKYALVELWRRIYRREIDTRGLTVNARHTLKNAV